MVPALYDDAEKEGLISAIRTELTAAGLPDTKDACWSAYVDKCRANLHVVLAMSPVGEALRTRCRNFPGLVNNTVIDWFEPWPEQVRYRSPSQSGQGCWQLIHLHNAVSVSMSVKTFDLSPKCCAFIREVVPAVTGLCVLMYAAGFVKCC